MTAVAAFTGGRAVTAPLTWGQHAIWKIIDAMAPNDAFLNVRRVVPVPDRAPGTVESVAAAVGALIARHESLRTRVRLRDGEPYQDVTGSGECLMEIIDSTPETAAATAEATMERQRMERFDYADGLPIRVTLIRVGERVTHIVLIFTHVAVDWYAVGVLDRELRVLLLRGGVATPPGQQPAELARQERGTAGALRTERALAHWAEQYRRFPAEILPVVGPGDHPRYRRVDHTSRAVYLAARAIAARHEASTSSVLLAAVGALIGAWTKQPVCGLLTIVNNRFQAGHRDVIAPINQLGVVTIDLTGTATFGDLVIAARHESMHSFRHAYYDQEAMDAQLAAGGHLRGAQIAPFCCFNDLRAPDGDLTGAAATEADLRAAAAESTTTVPEELDEFNWQFYLSISDAPGAVCLSLNTDACHLPTGDAIAFLLALEDLLVRAATGDVLLADLPGRPA